MNKGDDEKKKILFVDDEESFLKLLVEKFSDYGFDLLTATNGKEGLEIAERERPQVIVTDLSMPIMDGVEFITKLRTQDSWGKQVFIIILSNRGDMDSIADTMGLGAHHYFVKADTDLSKVLESVLIYTSYI
ncbi:MAG: response regulator [Patescibacteria group bacterium]